MLRRREIIRMDYRVGCIVFRVRRWRLGAGLGGATVLLWLVWSAGFSRLYHSMPAEFPRFLGSRNRWFSVVRRCPQLRVSSRSLHMLRLGSHRRNVPPTCRGFLLSCGTCLDSPIASVVAHPIHSDVIDRGVVNIVDVGDVHICDGAVIEEMSIVPAPAREAHPEVAESVVDAAIKSYRRPPKTLVENKRVAAPSPPARSPEETDFRRHHPRARHPVVIAEIVIPIPVSRRPDVAVTWAKWLLIHRQGRRPDCDRYSELRE